MLTTILWGITSGCIFSIPAGPVSVLIFKNSSLSGLKNGFSTLLGLISAEILYIFLYFFGLNELLVNNKRYFTFLALIGAIFLFIIGFNNLRRTKAAKASTEKKDIEDKKHKNFFESFLISIFNPAIMIFLIGVISIFLKNYPLYSNRKYILTLLFSVEAGTVIWFSAIIFLTTFLREKFSTSFHGKIQLCSSYLLMGCGLFIIFKNIFEVLI